MTATVLECTPAEYFADPCPEPSLSQSVARVLLDQSPKHAWAFHPRLGGLKRKVEKSTQATFDHGSIIDTLLLTDGAGLAEIDAESYRTKKAKEERDVARDMGLVPVLKPELDRLRGVVDRLREELTRKKVLLSNGHAQVPIQWKRGTIWCRALLDYLDGAGVWDIKTSTVFKPDTLPRHIVQYGYDIQCAAYVEGASLLNHSLLERQFRFVFCETEEPYTVTVVELPESMRELGRLRWDRSCKLWAECLESGNWPGYGTLRPEAPVWAMQRELEMV